MSLVEWLSLDLQTQADLKTINQYEVTHQKMLTPPVTDEENPPELYG